MDKTIEQIIKEYNHKDQNMSFNDYLTFLRSKEYVGGLEIFLYSLLNNKYVRVYEKDNEKDNEFRDIATDGALTKVDGTCFNPFNQHVPIPIWYNGFDHYKFIETKPSRRVTFKVGGNTMHVGKKIKRKNRSKRNKKKKVNRTYKSHS